MTTPAKLRTWRLANGLTQTQAAARFKKSLRTWQNYEKGGDGAVLPGFLIDLLVSYGIECTSAARKAEQDLNEAAIVKVESAAQQPRKKALGTPFDASGWGIPKAVVAPAMSNEDYNSLYSSLPPQPDALFE